MYLKQIEIRGFKSFADKTVLKLFPGMTAVVGPNGCGKSNIVDAIRWVLGEQSAKALRGSSMQDVIFEGTEKRKGLPTAEVILTFTDCEKELGTAYNEVEVSRRVTREGGSDYYINGKIVRLKDVQRLFANTGVGRVSYSFMLQGQIDQILSTNASERRTIFEEAAGITLYKSQRKEALNKLALVETNLNRVTDVIEEVGRQINSLKRQASKALRYRRIEHRYKHLDLALSAKRHSEFSANMQGSLSESAKLSEIVKKLTDELSEQEAQLLAKKQARQSVSEKIQAQQQKVYDLRSEKENASNQSELFSVRTEDSLSLIENFKKEIATLESELTQLVDRAKEEAETKQKQLNLMGDSDLNHQNQETEFVQSQEKLNALEAKLHSNRNAIFEIENTINRARSDSTSYELEIKTYQVKHADLIEKLVTYKQEIEVFEETFKTIVKQQTEHAGKLSELEVSITQAQDTATSKLNEFRQLQESYQQADRAIAKKTAHLHVLQNLQAKFEGFAEGAKSILSGGLGEIANESSVAIISKAIRVPQEYTLGLQTLLGMAVDALYIEDGKQSIRIIRELNEKQLGRVCLQIDTSNRLVTNQMEIPSHIVKVSSIVQISEQNLESTITKYLEGCYFAETLDEFINFWTENPDFQFTLVATKNGELIDARGLIYGGAESGKKSAGVLERSSEIQELEIAIADDRKQLNTIREKYEQVENQRNKATADVESLREALTELNKVSAAYESDVRAQKEKIERTVEARDKTESSLNQLDQAHSTLIANAERSKADLETAETAYKRLREDNEQCEKDITLVREHLETQRESLANVRLELAEKRQRLQSADEAIERAQGEKNSLEARISRRNQEINNIEEQIRKYKVDSEQAEAKAQEIELTQNSVLSELETNKAELKELGPIHPFYR
jgi:chromosome segregation protein